MLLNAEELTMSTLELRDRAMRIIETLPPARLKVAESFLTFLGSSGGKNAERELGVVAKMRQRIKVAEQEVTAGRTTHWRKVRDDV